MGKDGNGYRKEIPAGSMDDMAELFGDMGQAAIGNMSDIQYEIDDETEDEEQEDSYDLFGSVTSLSEKKYDAAAASLINGKGRHKETDERKNLTYASKRPKPEKIVINGKTYTDITGLITDTYSSEL